MGRYAVVAVVLIFAAGCGRIPIDPSILPQPDKPDGPKIVAVGQKVTYETEGTDPANLHEWRWRIMRREGGEETTDWDKKAEKFKHRFTETGTYELSAQEQCPLLKAGLRSPWSDARTTVVTAAAAGKSRLLFWLTCGH